MLLINPKGVPPVAKKTKQPDYHKSKRKHDARKIMIDLYRATTGLQTIPKDKQYWTLCNLQPDGDFVGFGSEINQILAAGLISKKSQFHGIDNNLDYILENKKVHPDANFYHGDWKNVVKFEMADAFNPAIIYFDTIYSIDNRDFISDLATTMNYAAPGTFIAANAVAEKLFCQKVYYDLVYKNLYNLVWEKDKWKPIKGEYYYRSNRLMMCTLFFIHAG